MTATVTLKRASSGVWEVYADDALIGRVERRHRYWAFALPGADKTQGMYQTRLAAANAMVSCKAIRADQAAALRPPAGFEAVIASEVRVGDVLTRTHRYAGQWCPPLAVTSIIVGSAVDDGAPVFVFRMERGEWLVTPSCLLGRAVAPHCTCGHELLHYYGGNCQNLPTHTTSCGVCRCDWPAAGRAWPV
jgi:hypothetical protein